MQLQKQLTERILPESLFYIQLLCMPLLFLKLVSDFKKNNNEPSFGKAALFLSALTVGFYADFLAAWYGSILTRQALTDSNFLFKDACGKQLNEVGFNGNSAWEIVPTFQLVLTAAHVTGVFYSWEKDSRFAKLYCHEQLSETKGLDYENATPDIESQAAPKSHLKNRF
jgi:hypothetical protein